MSITKTLKCFRNLLESMCQQNKKFKNKTKHEIQKTDQKEAKASYNDIYATFRKEKVHTRSGEANFWEKFSRKIRSTLLDKFFYLQ